MQSLRAFVTLLPMIACTTTPEMHVNWVEIAYRAGDPAEAQRSLNKLMRAEPERGLRLAKRLKLKPTYTSKNVNWSQTLQRAGSQEVLTLAQKNEHLRRPAFYRLLQLNDYQTAFGLADHPILKAMALFLANKPNDMETQLHKAASDPKPPLWAVRAWHQLRALQIPKSSAAAKAGWQALSELKAPTEAIKRVEKAPKGDCLRHVVESLAFEQIGRPAASADAAAQATCLPAKIQRARLLTRLRPAAAKMELEQLTKEAPLDHSLLLAIRQIHPADSAQNNAALNRLVAWYPTDHNALRDRLTQLEKIQNWNGAHHLCERSLRMRYLDEVHLLSLRYLALSGARHPRHAQHRQLLYRLAWLKNHRPEFKELTEIQALIAGSDEEGGGLGAAATQLNSPPKGEPKQDAPATAP